MHLLHDRHLAYCTNVHRGETWAETFAALETHALAVKARVCPAGEPFAIGLRLSDLASRQLAEPAALAAFRDWLEAHRCYVFTLNGFPFGRFHGARVKEQVYAPDWTTPERLEYTCRLFDLLAELLPPGTGGSVSTLPGSFKAFHQTPGWEAAVGKNLWRCVERIAKVSERCGRALQLGLEPEPLGSFENAGETLRFFEGLRALRPGDARLGRHLGVCYDACHFAVEYEEPTRALDALTGAGIPISKLHLSAALKVRASPGARAALSAFAEDTYLHQVIVRGPGGELTRHKDLDLALGRPETDLGEEWRIHFHIPLHCPPGAWFDTTSDHLLGALDWLKENPLRCQHLEMETYTWEVLPPGLKSASVVEQLAREYDWTGARLRERGLA